MADPLLRALREIDGTHESWRDDIDAWGSLSTYDDPDVSRVDDETKGEGDDDGE